MNHRNVFLVSLAALLIVVLFALSSAVVTSTYGASVGVSSSPASSYGVVPTAIISQVADQPTCSPSGLCPSMMDNAYGFNVLQRQGINGTGQTIVIDDACGDPNIQSDLQAFDSQFGLPNPKLTVIYPEGQKNLCTPDGWSVETSLDVEWSHVVAPGAAIDLLVANQPSAPDMYKNWVYALNHNLGNQISNSYGGSGCDVMCNNTIGQGIGPCDLTNGTQGFNVQKVLDEAEAKNVTILASAGDSGAWGIGKTEEPIPSDCTGVLTVGGTTLTVSSAGNYTSESAWSGTGGGYVTKPAEPAYQKFAEIKDPYGTLAKPDVAADANPDTGVWFYNSGWGVVGGTSLSSPLWTGFMALVNQIRASNGFHAAGFVSPFLYQTVYGKDGSSGIYAKDFHDIKTGNNGYPAGKGWDPDTGLGSFRAQTLAETLGSNETA